MVKCKRCNKEFKSRQGMLNHVQAVHQGIKVGGNPALLTLEGTQATAREAFNKTALSPDKPSEVPKIS